MENQNAMIAFIFIISMAFSFLFGCAMGMFTAISEKIQSAKDLKD